MTTIDDGGPAFPVECSYNGDGRAVGVQTGIAAGWETGMSLLDYFAAQALPSVISRCVPAERRDDESMEQMFARKAYAVAGAMLATRALLLQERK